MEPRRLHCAPRTLQTGRGEQRTPSSIIRSPTTIDCGVGLADVWAAAADLRAQPAQSAQSDAGLEHARPAFAENAMPAPIACECIFVEISNDRVPGSGRIEYRAETCPVCRLLDVRLLAGSTRPALFDRDAPKYQRVH
jgi:hypothetical protein